MAFIKTILTLELCGCSIPPPPGSGPLRKACSGGDAARVSGSYYRGKSRAEQADGCHRKDSDLRRRGRGSLLERALVKSLKRREGRSHGDTWGRARLPHGVPGWSEKG